jgi:biotin carboxylase
MVLGCRSARRYSPRLGKPYLRNGVFLAMRLCLVTSKPTDAVRHGFRPAAERLGLDLVLVTDRPADYPDVPVVECDVRDFRALIGCVCALGPDAVFSNSDHLQAQTALAAAYRGLPGKDWRSCLRAKDKALMRRHLAETGIEQVACWDPASPDIRFPAVLKPAEGVASEDVVLVRDATELAARRSRVGGRRMIVEEFLPGQLRTLETIGDGQTTWVLGGFRTDVSPPPFFIEECLTWDPLPAGDPGRAHVERALAALGVGFGACHTEFAGDRLIEVNDRLIGDRCEFLLCELFGLDLFELVLRVHLGERLPASIPPPVASHAVASYIWAEQSGVLRSAPVPGPVPGGEPEVRLSYWPMLPVGSRISLANSNRDYLGVLTAVGPDRDAVTRSVAEARSRGSWEISA